MQPPYSLLVLLLLCFLHFLNQFQPKKCPGLPDTDNDNLARENNVLVM